MQQLWRILPASTTQKQGIFGYYKKKKKYFYEKINLCQKARGEKKHYIEEYSRDLSYFACINTA